MTGVLPRGRPLSGKKDATEREEWTAATARNGTATTARNGTATTARNGQELRDRGPTACAPRLTGATRMSACDRRGIFAAGSNANLPLAANPNIPHFLVQTPTPERSQHAGDHGS